MLEINKCLVMKIKVIKKKILKFLVLLIFIQSCASLKNKLEDTNIEKLYLIQDDNKIILDSVVTIKRKNFSIYYYVKFNNLKKKEQYSMRIIFSLNKKLWNKIDIGMKENSFNLFEKENSLNKIKETLLFNNNGEYFSIYDNNNILKLVTTINGVDFEKYYFEFDNFFYSKKGISMNDSNLKEFFVVVLIDRNSNKVIDKNELYKFRVKVSK